MISFPKKRGGMYVFENAVFNDLSSADCNDTVNGVCEYGKSFEECLEDCEKSNECKSGYYIETPDQKNVCVPLYRHSDIQSPYYRLRNKNIYPILKAMKTTSFVKDIYPFPPNKPNAIFFGDSFIMKCIDSSVYISMNNDGKLTEEITFTNEEDKAVSLQFLPTILTGGAVENYTLIQNNDEVVINIPLSSFVLRKVNQEARLNWVTKATDTEVSNNVFQIHKFNDQKEGSLNFNDKIYFTYQNQLVVYNSELGILELKHSSDLTQKNLLFQLLPKVQTYFCDNGSCREVDLKNTNRNGENALYEGNIVSRSPSCWGMCGRRKSHAILIILAVIFAILIIFLFWKKSFF